jgi:hypothetical protein
MQLQALAKNIHMLPSGLREAVLSILVPQGIGSELGDAGTALLPGGPELPLELFQRLTAPPSDFPLPPIPGLGPAAPSLGGAMPPNPGMPPGTGMPGQTSEQMSTNSSGANAGESPQAGLNALFEAQQSAPNVPFERLFPPLIEKVKPKTKKPTKQEVQDKAEDAVRFWVSRNNRMAEEQDLYDRTDANRKKEDRTNATYFSDDEDVQGSRDIVLNDPYTIVEKLAQTIGGVSPTISIIPVDESQKLLAQKIEDLLYWWRDKAEEKWMQGIHGPLGVEEARTLALRGWICGRITWNPDDHEFPWRYSIIEPYHVYPTLSSTGDLLYVIYCYSDTKASVIADLSINDKFRQRLEKILKEKRDFESVQVTIYEDKEWRVILVDDEEITDKESAFHGYGFVPWVIQVFSGHPFRSRLEGGLTNTPEVELSPTWTEKIGTSILEGVKDGYKELNFLASVLATEAGKSNNPPIVVWTDEAGQQQFKEVRTGYGDTTHLLFDREKYEVVRPYNAAPYITALLTLLIDRQNRVLPQMLWGEGVPATSGFAYTILHGSARDVLYPPVRALEVYYRTLYKRVLELYVKFGDPSLPVKIITSDRATGARQGAVEVTRDEVEQTGYQIQVKYRNLAPIDKQMLGQLAALLVDKDIISRYDARGDEFLGLQNPSIVDTRIIGEKITLSPDIMRDILVPVAIYQEFGPLMAQLYMKKMDEVRMKEMGGAGFGGPMAGPGANPAKIPGLPPEVLPPELGVAAGREPPMPGRNRNIPPLNITQGGPR